MKYARSQTRETYCRLDGGSQVPVAFALQRTRSAIGMQGRAPGATSSATAWSELLLSAARATGARGLPIPSATCAMPFIGPLRFVLPENPMHGVISCSFRPIFAKLQLKILGMVQI